MQRTGAATALRLLVVGALAAGGLLAVAGPAAASGVCSWTGAGDGTHWSDSANWTGGVPGTDCDGVAVGRGITDQDIPGLRLSFVMAAVGATNTHVQGLPITLSDGAMLGPFIAPVFLDTDLVLEGTVHTNGPAFLDGALTGPGRLSADTTATLGGAKPSTNTGGLLARAALIVQRDGGAAVTAGPIVVDGALEVVGDQNLASASSVTVHSGASLEHTGTTAAVALPALTLAPGAAMTGAWTVGDVTVPAGTGTFHLPGTLESSGGTWDIAAGVSVRDIALTGSGAITKTGAGTLALGVSGLSGTTTVAAGTLQIDTSHRGPIQVTGGELDVDETGTPPSGPITVTAGTIATWYVSGGVTSSQLTLGPAATLREWITGVAGPPSSVTATDGVVISGAHLDPQTYGTPSIGQSFELIDNRSATPVVGTFAGLPEGATFVAGGIVWRLTYHGGDGNDVVARADRLIGSPYWRGWDIARGAQLLGAGGYVLDGWGGVHAFGGALPLRAAAYHHGTDTARGLTLQSDGHGGYVVDRNGRLTPYGSPEPLPCAVPASGVAPTRGVWIDPAWPAVASFAGATLDAWGGIHALCGSKLPDTTGAPAWKGWDIARGIAFTFSGGFVLDAWGGIHAFGHAHVTSSSGYWKGWDIARGIALAGNGTGVVIDGWGGLHTFTYTT